MQTRACLMVTLLAVLFTLAPLCEEVQAQQSSERGQAAILREPNPATPEDTAFWKPIYVLVQKSERLVEMNNLPGAQKTAEQALQMAGSRQSLIAEAVAPVYLQTGQYQKAASLFENDGFHAMSLDAAIAFAQVGRIAEARRYYRESQMLVYYRDFKPYLPAVTNAQLFKATVFLWRGITDVDQNRPRSAIWALQHALQIIPENPLALWYYAEALADVGRKVEAQHFFQAALMRDHGLVAQSVRASMARLGIAEGR